jgi:enoyl-CoA hydratase/carnithine racemase
MNMDWIATGKIGNIGVLTLNRGTTNPLNLEFLGQLMDALSRMREDAAIRGLVIAGSNDKFFSIGFDIPALLDLAEEDFRTFIDGFNQLSLELYTFPKPTLAAITGHAIAGGCILALCCDYRTIAQGRTLIGLNEIKLGLSIPFLADSILRDLVGSRIARDVMETGDFYPSETAEKMGLVDRVIASEQIRTESIEMAEKLGANSQKAYALIKSNRTRPVVETIMERMEEEEAALFECWYSDLAQELLKEAAEKF